jgi:hypothetical protein
VDPLCDSENAIIPKIWRMAEIVNLKHARKAKARAEAAAKAAENRATYGQTKAERARLALEKAKLRAVIDGAKKDE